MRWSYKTVHYELTKEGLLGSTFLDESAVELSLNEYGKAGWELVSMLETIDGLIAVFKQPLSLESRPDFAPEPREKKSDYSLAVPSVAEVDDIDYLLPETGEGAEPDNDFVLLDDFEVIEEENDRVEPEFVKKKDIGSIRIE